MSESIKPPSLTKLDLISKLMGKALDDLKEFEQIAENKQKEGSESLIKTEGLSKAGFMNPYDIRIGKGDVVGLAGLLGSGRSEIAGMLFGIARARQGQFINQKQND